MEEGLSKMTVKGNGEAEMLGKVIGVLFMSRTYAHTAHLKTASYAKHKALNKFYDEIVDLADDLAEASQGTYGKLDIPFVNVTGKVEDPIGALEGHLSMIKKLVAKCSEPFLGNIVQEIEACFRKTLYLMKELN